MSETSRQSPASEKQAQLLTALGVLGLVPFVVPPVLGFEALAGGLDWRTAQALYGATILGFLGGVRAACAAFAQTPRLADIVLSMAPPLAGYGLAGYGLAAVAIGGRGSPGATGQALFGLAIAFAVQGVWDLGAKDLPYWYRRLRLLLTIAATLALIAGGLRAGL